MTKSETDCSPQINYQDHWNNAYQKNPTEKLGWYEEHSTKTLELIKKTKISKDAKILNVGVGSSTIIDDLLNSGYTNLIANDLAENSLNAVKLRIGDQVEAVDFVVDDLTNPLLLQNYNSVDLWNDRAVLHFFLEEEEIQSYFNLIKRVVAPNGFVILAEFAEDGAEKCCGLPLQRYNVEMLQKRLGDEFELIESFDYTFVNPYGGERPYVYTLFQRKSKAKVTHVPFQKTGYFSSLMCDYLDGKESIKSYYSNEPNIEGFKNQIEQKRSSFSLENRHVLVNALKEQYQKVNASEETKNNIELLALENTFTVTTGHQLNLFTGPLYFLYKIISTINLCEDLKSVYPKENFVPIYWMATEDHDFDEINYFNFKGAKVVWNREDGGAVGRFSTKGLEEVFEEFSSYLGTSRNATYLKNLFSKAYLDNDNLADATRFLANELFAEYGLVIVEADNAELKSLLKPYVKKDLLEQISYQNVIKTNETLGENYKIQVNPREINLFYLTDDLRERIVFEDDLYKVNNTDVTFTKDEILQEADSFPERFSPNVIMRPLYQEVILPNLCYIGGGGELAYWFELKSYFDAVAIPFPILLLRNSVLISTLKQQQKMEKLEISIEEIFKKQQVLIKDKVLENSQLDYQFSETRTQLEKQFKELRKVAEETDNSFIGAVNAQEIKQLKGLDNLEKRLLRAEKKNQKDRVERMIELQNQLFPNQSLEERQRNFSDYYLEYGSDLIPVLKKSLKPLQLEFTVLTMS